MKTILILFSILSAFSFIAWAGLQIKPTPFALVSLPPTDRKTVALPDNLPAPVKRFYLTVYGNEIPVIDSGIFTGRAVIRPFMNIALPARFVFVHNAGQGYRHYIEATFFGMPFLKVNEGYLDGKSFFESPMGTFYNDANTNQGANLALWAEAGWFPSLWVTDPRVHWEAVDDRTALLIVPFENQTETFVVRFNPLTHLIDMMEAMRYREAGEGKSKILWITRNEPDHYIANTKLSAVGSATWLDQGTPWAVFTIEESSYNVDVRQYIRARGQ